MSHAVLNYIPFLVYPNIWLLIAYHDLSLVSDESSVVTGDSIFVLLQCIMKIGHKYDAIFPLIDLMRLMIRNYSVNVLLCGELNLGDGRLTVCLH